jgi:hypothetical protein
VIIQSIFLQRVDTKRIKFVQPYTPPDPMIYDRSETVCRKSKEKKLEKNNYKSDILNLGIIVYIVDKI